VLDFAALWFFVEVFCIVTNKCWRRRLPGHLCYCSDRNLFSQVSNNRKGFSVGYRICSSGL